MPKRDIEGVVKIQENKLHVYHNVIDPQTGKIDQTDFMVCKCKYCSVWTPEVIKHYNDFLFEDKYELNRPVYICSY